MNRLLRKARGSAFDRWAWAIFLVGGALGTTLLGQVLLLLSTVAHNVDRVRRIISGEGGAATGATISAESPISDGAFARLGKLFFGATLISAAFSDHPGMAVAISAGFALLFFVIALGTTSLVENTGEDDLTRVVPWMLVAGVVGALYGIHGVIFQGIRRAVGLGAGPNGFGGLNAFLVILAVGYLVQRRSLGWWFAAVPVYLVALGLSVSRGSWLGLAASVIVFVLLMAMDRLRERRAMKLMGVALSFLITLSLLVVFIHPTLQDRLLSSFDIQRNDDRIRVWQTSIEMIKDRPLTGVGGGVFPLVFEQYRVEREKRLSVSFAHNLPLQILAEFGILGFVPFAGLIGLGLVRGWRLARRTGPLIVAVYAGLIGMLVHDLFDNVTYGMNMGGLFWFLLGFCVHMERKLQIQGRIEPTGFS